MFLYFVPAVLILVLMDNQNTQLVMLKEPLALVLILVLMDNQNTDNDGSHHRYGCVLILVLMDNQNTTILIIILMETKSLNPCSNG